MAGNKEGQGSRKITKLLRILKRGPEHVLQADNQYSSSDQSGAFVPSWKVFDCRQTTRTVTTPGIAMGTEERQIPSGPRPPNTQPRHKSDPFGDRKRTEQRYNEAVKKLENALKLRPSNWEAFETPNLADISDNDPIPQLRAALDKMLDSRKSSIKNQDVWSKCKKTMTQIFTAMSPFAKIFLQIAKDAQAVYPAIHHRLLTSKIDSDIKSIRRTM